MRARRAGNGPEFRLLQDEQEIGRVDGTRVRFLGFATRDDAALAASVAHLALTRLREKQRPSAPGYYDVPAMDDEPSQAVVAPAAVLATLVPPAVEGSAGGGWGFEIGLLPEEGVEVFAIARARVMWRALRSTGVYRRMRQFRAAYPAAA
jgi:hypothetical protein